MPWGWLGLCLLAAVPGMVVGYLAHWRAMQLRSTERRSHPWVSGSRARADLPLTTVVVHGRRRARRELVTAPK